MTEQQLAVMKQALEALEQWNTPLYKRGNVINSLRQAIEQAETEKQDKFCDNNCVWTDHHPDCVSARGDPKCNA